MTSKDKTGDKLVASIRKSKSGTVASKTSERPAANESADRTETSAGKPESTARTASSVATKQDRNDNYSVGRRVWPD